MYGHALLSIRHVSSATGPQTTAPVTRATAVAACVSSLPDSSRFHTACTTAAASASRRAEVGRRALYDGAAHSAFAHAGALRRRTGDVVPAGRKERHTCRARCTRVSLL